MLANIKKQNKTAITKKKTKRKEQEKKRGKKRSEREIVTRLGHIACVGSVAGVRKGRGRVLGRQTARERGERRGTPASKPLFLPSRPLMEKITQISQL